jgi:hypothetical protein
MESIEPEAKQGQILINQENTHLCKHCGKMKADHEKDLNCPKEQPGVISIGDTIIPTPSTKWEVGDQIGHRYYRVVWNYNVPPYSKNSIYLESYNRISKKFTIIVLYDKRKVDTIPVGYPLVPITEQEAQDLVEHRRNHLAATTNRKNQNMELSNLNVETVAPALHVAHHHEHEHKHHSEAPVETPTPQASATAPVEPSQVETVSDPTTAPAAADRSPVTSEKKNRSKVERNGRPSVRSLVIQGLAEGKTNAEMLPMLKSLYPERDEKKLKILIYVSKHSYEKALEKKARKSSPSITKASATEPVAEAAVEAEQSTPTE